jgi:hypothetical protein
MEGGATIQHGVHHGFRVELDKLNSHRLPFGGRQSLGVELVDQFGESQLLFRRVGHDQSRLRKWCGLLGVVREPADDIKRCDAEADHGEHAENQYHHRKLDVSSR